MAIESNPKNHSINTSNSNSNSPRISFSFNFCQSDNHAQAYSYSYSSHPSTPATSDNFEFSIPSSCMTLQETSLADDIFSNGKILPLDINRKNKKENTDHFHFSGKQTIEEEDDEEDDDDDDEEEEEEAPDSFHPPPSVSQTIPPKSINDAMKLEDKSKSENGTKSSFWGGFRKSGSLNSTSSCSTRLCFLPIMVRTNSTGSSSSSCPPSTTKSIVNMKPQDMVSSIPKCHRNPKPPSKKGSVSSSSSSLYNHSNSKSFAQVDPVVNVVCTGSPFFGRKSKSKIKPNGSSSF